MPVGCARERAFLNLWRSPADPHRVSANPPLSWQLLGESAAAYGSGAIAAWSPQSLIAVVPRPFPRSRGRFRSARALERRIT